MGRLKLTLRVGGVLSFMCGLMFIPVSYGIVSYGIAPKGYRSVFNVLVDSGVFFKTGFFKTAVLLMAIGAVVYIISLLLPGEME